MRRMPEECGLSQLIILDLLFDIFKKEMKKAEKEDTFSKMRTAFFARKCSVIELLVDDGLFGFFVKDMDAVGIKCNFDFVAHLRLTACIHTSGVLLVVDV